MTKEEFRKLLRNKLFIALQGEPVRLSSDHINQASTALSLRLSNTLWPIIELHVKRAIDMDRKKRRLSS